MLLKRTEINLRVINIFTRTIRIELHVKFLFIDNKLPAYIVVEYAYINC